jgi:ABC-type Fe3+ transport system permease subunit
VLATALVWLLAFGEFEIASRMGVRAWPVWFFDQHQGGLALTESLQRSLLPLVLQVAVLLPCAALVLQGREDVERRLPPPAAGERWFSRTWVALALGALVLVPGSYIVQAGLPALRQLPELDTFWSRLGYSVMFGAAAAICAYMLAGVLWSFARGNGRGRRLGVLGVAGILCAVGLFGPLLLSLVTLHLVTRPSLTELRDSPVPLLAVQMLLLLPLAFALLYLSERARAGRSEHAASLLTDSQAGAVRREGGRILWHLRARGKAAALFLLFCWGYWELVAGELLSPLTMQTAPGLLYNQMHYGGTAQLSAMVTVFFALPLALLAGTGLFRCAYVTVTAHA